MINTLIQIKDDYFSSWLFVLFEWIEWREGWMKDQTEICFMSTCLMCPWVHHGHGLINQLTKLFADSYIQLGWSESDDVMEVLSAVHKLHVTQFQFDHKSAIGSHSTHKKANASQCLASIATLCLHTNSPPFVQCKSKTEIIFSVDCWCYVLTKLDVLLTND